jgi:hypothetical protein
MGNYRSGGDANIVESGDDGTLATAAADSMSKVAKMKQLAKNKEEENPDLDPETPITKRGCAPIKKVMKRNKKSCWKGYERTPNTKKGAKGSCRKIRGGKK